MRRSLVLLLALFVLTCSVSWLYAADADVVVLKGARLIDGTGSPAVENSVVVIKGGKIRLPARQLGQGAQRCAGSRCHR